ncbi:unnamed protein product [Prorocentrum cordatum]|uniref:Uncharacterized protein n=1 Tax=Prorocentrum cordatum TaxID=2364126 RepID=A0ABN9UXR8_9DINO|nr:unnamed protein product [Polarella glacialis]
MAMPPPPFVASAQQIIDAANNATTPAITAYEDIREMLVKDHIVSEQKFLADDILAHPANRGKLGLNAYNAHKNLSDIAHVGRESYLSAGTGHFTAATRACKAHCRTPFKNIANADGPLSEALGHRDKRLGSCMDNGWVWRAFPWQREVAWPGLPDLCQRALNAAHGVSSRSTELQTMVWLSDLSADKDDAINAAKSASPMCASYIEAVVRLVELISGGAGAPVLHFLDRFSKTFGENNILGEEFITAVATAELNKCDAAPFFRAAPVATNLASLKVVDGVAKLIYKSDADKSKGKDEILKLNTTLKDAWKLADKAMIHQTDFDMTVGKFMVRAVLFHLGRQHQSPENKQYESIDDIKSRFAIDLKPAAGDSAVDLGDFAVKIDDSKDTAAAGSDAAKIGAMSFDEMASPAHVLKDKAGIEIGSQLREKNISDGFLFEVKALNDGGKVLLTQVKPFDDDDCIKVEVGYKVLVYDWKAVKEKVSFVCASKDISSEVIEDDRLRPIVFMSPREEHAALMKTGKACHGPPILHMRNPVGTAMEEDVSKNIFKFTPTAPMQNILCTNPKGAENNVATVTIGGKAFFATSVRKPADDTVHAFFAPYWWVKTTPIEGKANMKFVKVVGADGVSYPALQNFKPLKVHERLYYFKPKDIKTALQNATVIRSAVDHGEKGNAGEIGKGKGKNKRGKGNEGGSASGGKPEKKARKV